jgi:hypothetical protein
VTDKCAANNASIDTRQITELTKRHAEW